MNVMFRMVAEHLSTFPRPGVHSALALLISLLLISVGIRVPASTG
jgi:hypothetical protein